MLGGLGGGGGGGGARPRYAWPQLGLRIHNYCCHNLTKCPKIMTVNDDMGIEKSFPFGSFLPYL